MIILFTVEQSKSIEEGSQFSQLNEREKKKKII